MAKIINCDCGYVVKGDSDADLLADADQHIEAEHPDLVGKVSHDDLLAMAEETE